MATKEEKEICLGTYSREKIEEIVSNTHAKDEEEGKEYRKIIFASSDGDSVVCEDELDEKLPSIPLWGLASQTTPDELREDNIIPSQELLEYWN
jgi:hypothetical protein